MSAGPASVTLDCHSPAQLELRASREEPTTMIIEQETT
jgi:hypothetical protein